MAALQNDVLQKFLKIVEDTNTLTQKGKISQIVGLTIESNGPRVSLGELCRIKGGNFNAPSIMAEVVGFRGNKTLLMPLGDLEGIGPGS
ncbi:MAG: EscN/YscN/HrcN family type III secretion system ATPase, partial [Ignavibacteriales bacterium]